MAKANPFDNLLSKSIRSLKANSKAVEKAIEKLLNEEGIEVSEKEYREIKQLTDTMSELDSVLLSVENTPQYRPKKKSTKKKKAVRKKRRK